MNDHDPVLAELRALPPIDLEAGRAEVLRRQARAVMAEAHSRTKRATSWYSLLEPALVALVIVVYAGWGLATIGSLFRAVDPPAEVAVASAK